jgi:hypothetical protein
MDLENISKNRKKDLTIWIELCDNTVLPQRER